MPNEAASHAKFAGFNLRDTNCRAYGGGTAGLVFSEASEEKRRAAAASYYAVVTGYDKQIGPILDELDRTGLARNTIVFFASDNRTWPDGSGPVLHTGRGEGVRQGSGDCGQKAWSGCPIRIWYKDWKPAPDWKPQNADEAKR